MLDHVQVDFIAENFSIAQQKFQENIQAIRYMFCSSICRNIKDNDDGFIDGFEKFSTPSKI